MQTLKSSKSITESRDNVFSVRVHLVKPQKKRGRKPKSDLVRNAIQNRKTSSFSVTISIDFDKIDRMKKEEKNYTKSIYSSHKSLPYDNDEMPRVRFPMCFRVPTHLLEEFSEMFPEEPDGKSTQGKISLLPREKMDGKSITLLQWLVHYHWRDTEKLDDLAKILLHQKHITLTHLDWLCTNYSMSHDVRYPDPRNPHNPIEFNVHISYEQRLRAHVRSFFDVFARSVKILVEWETHDVELFEGFVGNKPDTMDIKWDLNKKIGMRRINGKMMVYLVTTVGQLHFFGWAMSHGVVDYCIEHVHEIARDYVMKQGMPSPSGKKRRKLSEAPPTSIKVRKLDMCTMPGEGTVSLSHVEYDSFGNMRRVAAPTEVEFE